MTDPQPDGRAELTYYGHNTQELGHEVPTPSNLTINVKLDVRTAAGTSTIKQRMRGQLAWLMTEGMELPVQIDPGSGLAVKVDTDRLEEELQHRSGAAKAAAKDQARILYDVPSRQELADLKNAVTNAGRGIRGLFRRG